MLTRLAIRSLLATGLLVVLVAAAAAQPPPRDRPQAPGPGTGVIRGRVVRADTGEPLRRAQVSVEAQNAKDLRGPVSTMTDAQGRYEIDQLPAGSYQLKASRGGYVELAYGQRRPFERGRPLELAEGAVLQNIDFALPSGGVITGRVVDEIGEPVARASVSVARRRYVDGQRGLVTQNGASTDDRGEFRIFGVAPGEYVMSAVLETMDFGSRDRVRYVPTYYPSTPAASEAQRVTVRAGQEVPGITIALVRVATATVRGVVRAAGLAQAGPFTMVHAREIGGPRAYGSMTSAIAASDGAFTLTGLLPGTYLVEAQSAMGSGFASKEVVVDGADLAGVTLTLSDGTTARGRIRFDTGEPPQGLRPSEVLVMPSLLDPQANGMHMSGNGPPTAKDDWTFEVHGLSGRGFLRAGTMGDWEMKRVLREDADVSDTPLDFSTDVDGLVIELTQKVTTVSGGVSDDRNRPVLDATVVVFADDPARWWRQSRFIESARPDQQGRFTIRGLPPGKYVAIAVGYLEPGEEHDPDLLQDWRERGTRFTLSEAETRAMDLRLSGS